MAIHSIDNQAKDAEFQLVAVHDNIADIYPLSPLQQGMLFQSLYAPNAHLYVDCMRFGVQGTLNTSAFREAWQFIVQRHTAIRTVFAWEGQQQPLQIVLKAMQAPMEEVDLRSRSAASSEEELTQLESRLRNTPFTLNKPPLTRMSLVRTADDAYQLIWAIHHLLIDGWSASQLLGELFIAYCAFEQGLRPELPSPRPYRDYIEWLQQQDKARAESYWRTALQGWTTPTFLPYSEHKRRPPVEGSEARFAKRTHSLPKTVTKSIQSFANAHRLTLNTVVQGAWALVLSKHAEADDIVFGGVVSGRPTTLENAETMIGMFINTIPVRVRTDRSMRVIDWLAGLQTQQAEARQFDYSPLVDVHGWSEIARNEPLFGSIVVFENLGSGSGAFRPHPDLEISRQEHQASTTGYPLTVVVEPIEQLTFSLFYERERFTETQVDDLLTQLGRFVTGMAEHGQSPLSELDCLSSDERHQLLTRWNQTETDYPRQPVHQLFETQVEQSPDAVAMVVGDQHLSYSALNTLANQVAHRLIEQGVRPAQPVGICVESSLQLVRAALGILKAGGVYVPLDPSYPDKRIDYMLQDAGVGVLLTDSHRQTNANILSLCIDTELSHGLAHTQPNPCIPVDPDQLAYVMYTSGSTGQPKGIGIPHRGITRLVRNTIYVDFHPSDCMAQVSNHSFDAATFEIWGSLLNGAKLVAIEKDTALSSSQFAAYLRERNITTMFLTSALFSQVARESPNAFALMRHLLVGGQAVDPQWARKVLAAAAPEKLLNGYGPTESTTFAAYHHIATVAEHAESIPIGSPISNTSLHVLDRLGNVVPIEVHGELCIGGDGLALFYVGRPELTAESFVPDPYATRPGQRLYRTGDCVVRRRDGFIEFIGRYDNQVKLRGFRIELGEIEAALLQHDDVAEAIVLARTDESEDMQLVAYLVADLDVPSDEQIRDFLRSRLPSYMVPAIIVYLPKLPLTPNGKVDRKALPAPDRSKSKCERVISTAPVEEIIGGIWASVLRIGSVASEDNFFNLGGHSLLATQVVSRTTDAFQVPVTLRDLFEASSLHDYSRRVEAYIRSSQDMDNIPLLPASRNEDMPLSFAQQRLWFVDQVDPGNPSYNIFTAVRLKGTLNVQALQQSLNEIVQRHESLRTTFGTQEGHAVQIIVDELKVEVPLDEVAGSTISDREQELHRAIAQESVLPFQLQTGPLLRARLYRMQPDDHVVTLTMHHIIGDEWSLGIMVRELAALYAGFSEDTPSPLPALPIQYADFAVWQRQWLEAGNLDKQLTYWRQQLAGPLPELKLPADRPHPASPTYAGSVHSFQLDPNTASSLTDLCRQEGVTMFMACLAVLQTLLRANAGQDDIVVGTDVANRNRLETEGLIGFFVNHLVLRTNLEGNPPFRELLQRVREVTLGAYLHQDVPFDRLVATLQPERKSQHTPLFQVLFVFGNPTSAKLEVPGLSISSLGTDDVRAKYDLTLFMHQGADSLGGAWRYRSELFDPMTIQALSDDFVTLLQQVVKNPATRLDRLERSASRDASADGGGARRRGRKSVEFQT